MTEVIGVGIISKKVWYYIITYYNIIYLMCGTTQSTQTSELLIFVLLNLQSICHYLKPDFLPQFAVLNNNRNKLYYEK